MLETIYSADTIWVPHYPPEQQICQPDRDTPEAMLIRALCQADRNGARQGGRSAGVLQVPLYTVMIQHSFHLPYSDTVMIFTVMTSIFS